MAVDPFIEAAFGPPPAGIDLTEDQAAKNNVIVIVLLAFAALSVFGRLISRSKYGPGLSFDDYAIVVAWVLVAATAGMVVASEFFLVPIPLREQNIDTFHTVGQAGAGRHVWALGVDDIVRTTKASSRPKQQKWLKKFKLITSADLYSYCTSTASSSASQSSSPKCRSSSSTGAYSWATCCLSASPSGSVPFSSARTPSTS